MFVLRSVKSGCWRFATTREIVCRSDLGQKYESLTRERRGEESFN